MSNFYFIIDFPQLRFLNLRVKFSVNSTRNKSCLSVVLRAYRVKHRERENRERTGGERHTDTDTDTDTQRDKQTETETERRRERENG